MRSLFVAEVFPWPARDGYRLRLSNLVEALAALGQVDLVCTEASEFDASLAPTGVNVLAVPEGPQRSRTSWMPAWILHHHPRRVVWRDFDGLTERIEAVLAGPYDVAMFGHLEVYLGVGAAAHEAARIVDFDNLENLSMRSQRSSGPDVYPHMGGKQRAKAIASWLGRTSMNLIDERRWTRVQNEIAGEVDRVFVCSELDVERADLPNAVSIPNGYELDWPPRGDRPGGSLDAPQFMFVGGLSYPPNADAARWFATEILPIVHRTIPAASFRIIGRGQQHVADLVGLSGVTVVGAVDSLQEELDRADIAVVPIRTGAGTRLKVVEALANRLPLVSTPVGSEGIEVIDGEHVLFADDADEFAANCVRLAQDADLREHLAAHGYQRFEDRYQWSTIRGTIGDVVAEVVAHHQN